MTTSESALSTRPRDALNRNQLLELYYYVRLTRDVEERLTILFRQNKVLGGLYRSLGQEGESVASAYALGPSDALATLTRNLGSMLTLGVRPRDVFAQYLAKGTSPTRGREQNLHFAHVPDADSDEPFIIGPISPLGDSIPVLAGIILGRRMQGRPIVGMTYIGDGGTSTGPFHEGLNFAAVLKLPFVLVIEDNKYAFSTPIARQMAIERVSDRALSYGIPSVMVDGNDMLAVYDAAKEAVGRARGGGGPSVIGVDTMRMKGHAEHDDMRYVDKALLAEWTARDPIQRYRNHLIEQSTATEAELADLDRQTKAYAEAESQLALEMPMPDPATAGTGVFAGPDTFPAHLELVRSPFDARR